MHRHFLPRSAIGWIAFAFLLHGASLRALSLPTVLLKWANSHHKSAITVVPGLVLGALEDGCVGVGVCIILWLMAPFMHRSHPRWKASLAAILFLLSNVLLCVDLVFVRTRQMRFRWDFVSLYWRERRTDAWRQLQIEDAEWMIACEMSLITVSFTTLVWWQLGSQAPWIHSPLSDWDVRLWRMASAPKKCSHHQLPTTRSINSSSEASDDASLLIDDDKPPQDSLSMRLWRLLVLWVVWIVFTVGITKCTPSILAIIAWNASLCEPLRLTIGVECIASRPIPSTDTNLRQHIDTRTENCSFLGEDTGHLVRQTHNFVGALAFDVVIKPHERPNVLLIAIESFRQRDSRYLLDPELVEQFLPRNISLTPNFDRWTSRGVGFRNMWSTWRTSRSLEQLLFGQLPLESATDSGTTTGRKDVELSGLPQLFRAKGYDTLFTSGSRLDYDDWDVFLPNHGFDTVLSGWDLADIGERDVGIDWTEGDRSMVFWGIHDDVSFDVFAHLLKQRQQKKKASKGKPFFATHYTISSHVPFDERPDWFFRMKQLGELPDFAPLYEHIEDDEIRELVQNYAEMRYFTDLCFGIFMAELERSGVLNDTIVVVTADHGHAPERGVAMPEEHQASAMNVPAALIAEGRLGKYAGMIVDEPTAQYDWLNTIADIIGVPDGFIQTGIGRSLKRQWPQQEQQRVVYSNNPALNLGAVQGHTRIEFFLDVVDVMRVFNLQTDPDRHVDLVGELPRRRMNEIQRICDQGRELSAYFARRWSENCLLPPLCEPQES